MSIDNQRINSELMICVNCGYKIHAHEIATDIIRSGLKSPQKAECPICGFEYDLEWLKCENIMN